MTPHPLLPYVLLTVLAACGSKDDEGDGASSPDPTSDTGVEPTSFDLGACTSAGGGKLNETTCYKGWDCAEGLFEVSCQGNPETCTCSVDGEEIQTFEASSDGEVCGSFSDGDFADSIQERCRFPTGETSPDTSSSSSTTDLLSGRTDLVSDCGNDGVYELGTTVYEEVKTATLLLAWTGIEDATPSFEYVWGEEHFGSVVDRTDGAQPAFDVGFEIETDDVDGGNPDTLLTCAQMDEEATYLLRLTRRGGGLVECVVWGHDPSVFLDGDADEISLFVVVDDATLEGCVAL